MPDLNYEYLRDGIPESKTDEMNIKHMYAKSRLKMNTCIYRNNIQIYLYVFTLHPHKTMGCNYSSMP